MATYGIPFGSGSLSGYCAVTGAGEAAGFGGDGIHCWDNINDGQEGNSNSWIPGDAYNGLHFVGVRFEEPIWIGGLRVSRNSDNSAGDRTGGTNIVEYSDVAGATQLSALKENVAGKM